VGGRNVPWWLAGTSMVATTFAADTPWRHRDGGAQRIAGNGCGGTSSQRHADGLLLRPALAALRG